MEAIINTLQTLLAIGAIGTFFIGIFKPSFLIKRPFAGKRLLLILSSLVFFFFIGTLETYKVDHVYTDEEREQYYAERREQAIQDSIKKENKRREKFVRDSIKLAEKQQKEPEKNKQLPPEENIHTITIPIDTALVICYKHEFDSLYNVIIEMDKGQRPSEGLADCHKKIRDLLKEWLNTMDELDPDAKGLPYSTKEWTKADKRYYNLSRIFDLYGDGDIFDIRFWAKEDAETILREILNDPSSLKINKKDIQVYKTAEGWKCIVPYRSKNVFGAYVLDRATFIMNYDVEAGRYTTIDAY